MSKPVESVTYVTDSEKDAFALVVGEDGSHYDLAYLDPDDYTWHSANRVPKDSDRLK